VRTLALSVCCIPDLPGVRRLNSLPAELPDVDVATFAWQQARVRGSEQLPCHLQRILNIAFVCRDASGFSVNSFSGDEQTVLKSFADQAASSDLILDWEVLGLPGQGALPVLDVRSVIHHVASHTGGRRISLAQHLAALDPLGGPIPLREMLCLSGIPDQAEILGADGYKIWQCYQDGGLPRLVAANEIRALALTLMWIRQRLALGEISHSECLREYAALREFLQGEVPAHLQDWFGEWSRVGRGL